MANASDGQFSRKRLGDLEVLRELGPGGMRIVYAAWLVSLNREVTLNGLGDRRWQRRGSIRDSTCASGLAIASAPRATWLLPMVPGCIPRFVSHPATCFSAGTDTPKHALYTPNPDFAPVRCNTGQP